MKRVSLHILGPENGLGYWGARKFSLYQGGGRKRHEIIHHPAYYEVFAAFEEELESFAILPQLPGTEIGEIIRRKVESLTRNYKSKSLFLYHEYWCNSRIPKTQFVPIYNHKKKGGNGRDK